MQGESRLDIAHPFSFPSLQVHKTWYNGNRKCKSGFHTNGVSYMALKDSIAQAATEEFQEKGLSFTMADVARRLRISKKTIYAEYASKEALLSDMIARGFAKIHQQKKAILDSSAPLTEKLRQVVIALPEEYRALDFRRLEHLGEKYPRVAAQLKTQLEINWEPTLSLVREGVKQGVLRPVSVPVLRLMIIGSIETFLNSGALQGERIAYDDALHSMMDILIGGLAARPV